MDYNSSFSDNFPKGTDYSSTFPKQKVTERERTQDWKEQTVNSIIGQCNSLQSKRRSSFRQKRRNYDLFNNKIDESNFKNVLNPFSLTEEQLSKAKMPATLQPYDVLSPIFMLLFGEERKRMFSPIVRAVNADSIIFKEQQKEDAIVQALQEFLINQEMSEEYIQEQVNKLSGYSYKDRRESNAQHLLTYLSKKERTQEVFQEGWKDALIVGEEIYDIQNIAGSARIRRVNPLEINYILSANSSQIDDADKIYEKNILSVSEIIDEFYEDLSPAQIDDLECRRDGKSTIYNYDFNNPHVSDYFGDNYFAGQNIGTVNSIYDLQDSNTKGIAVHRTRWKGKRKIGILYYLDESNQEQMIQVDEFYKENKKNPDERVEWFWINEYWEGIRIGQDMYLKIQPRKNQFRSLDNLSECKSGYTGTLYNALNSQSTSLMDRLVPWVYLYLTTWYRTELLLAANQGKIGLLDLSLVPDGWEIEKWLYYASAMKIGFINSFSEKNKNRGANQSTQNKILDLTQGNEIQFYISLLEFIEQKIEDTSGVSRQRKGQISSSERVGNTERSVVQSSHITEEWFAVHNYTKLRALECLIKVAQDIISENGDKAFLYMTNDSETVSGIIDKNISDVDLGIFITNSERDQLILQTFQEHLNEALQNDKIDFSQIADLIGSESIADIKNALKEGEQKRKQAEQQAQEQQLNAQQQMHDEQIALEYEKLDRVDMNAQLDREVKLATEEMKALGFDEGSNTLDISAVGDQALKQQELNIKHIQEKEKLDQRDREIESTHALKEKELQMKKEIENKKLQAVREQNQNQIILANKKAKLDEKMMNQKLKLEAMKAKAAIKKSKQKPK